MLCGLFQEASSSLQGPPVSKILDVDLVSELQGPAVSGKTGDGHS